MSQARRDSISRRQFLSATAAGAAVVIGAPAVLTANKTDSTVIIGEGDDKYEIAHEWPQLPDKDKDGGGIRGDRNQWQAGKFVHPHDACFGKNGDIFVAEWVRTGRVSKLKRLV